MSWRLASQLLVFLSRGSLLAALFSCSVLVSGAHAACGAELVPAIAQRLTQPEVLRGEFTQRKSVAGFSKPLQSTGRFLVARKYGVLWQTQRPFAGELRLTRNQILASHNGVETFRLDAEREPAISAINGLMFSLLNGDISALAEHFSITGDVDGARWQLVLDPRQPTLAKIMQQVQLRGDQHVQKIIISEANGDHTEIEFRNQLVDTSLTAAEVASFD